MARIALIAALLSALSPAAAIQLQDLVQSYGLTESYNFSFPTQPLSDDDADSWILDKWSVNSEHGISFGKTDITFVQDPAASAIIKRELDERASKNSTTKVSSADGPVLRIEYPQGSYSAGTGGTQFYAQPLNATSGSKNVFSNTTSNGQFERMLLSYDIFFEDGFKWNKGGKLPGLRGGPDPIGCSGGHKSDGLECFSSRLMWRDGSLGEVYAYIPTDQKGFCTTPSVTCNSDFGVSLSRGMYSFKTGRWQTVWLYVALNQVGIANGVMELWYDGVPAVKFANLEIRDSEIIESIGGLYFSTFFGGYDSSWATPATQYSYFRNIQLYAGLGAANGTGKRTSGATTAQPSNILFATVACVVVAVAGITL